MAIYFPEKKLIIILCLLFINISSICSQIHRCGIDVYEKIILKDSLKIEKYRNRIKENEDLFRSEAYTEHRTEGDTIIIPVAVHFQGLNTIDSQCLNTLTENQIEILNQYYQGSNDEQNSWQLDSVHFPEVELGRALFKFVLANKNHPTGYGLTDGDLAITYNQVSESEKNNWQNYLNIFVLDIPELGISPYGGAGNGDGVYISLNSFGADVACDNVQPEAPFDEGKTLIHEIGHYFFLRHIWGSVGCLYDDEVNDTPPASLPNQFCPADFTTSCNSLDLHVNFMDYVDDACMYMFTKGQVERMVRYIETNLSNITDNAPYVYEGESLSDCEQSLLLETQLINDSLIFSWTTSDNATFYELQLKESNSETWENYVTPSNKLKLPTSLYIPDRHYDWRVSTVCWPDQTEWTTSSFFLPINESYFGFDSQITFVHAFPNPFNEQLTIGGKMKEHLETNSLKLYIYNSIGVLVFAKNISVGSGINYFEAELETSNLLDGLYTIIFDFGNVQRQVLVVKNSTL